MHRVCSSFVITRPLTENVCSVCSCHAYKKESYLCVYRKPCCMQLSCKNLQQEKNCFHYLMTSASTLKPSTIFTSDCIDRSRKFPRSLSWKAFFSVHSLTQQFYVLTLQSERKLTILRSLSGLLRRNYKWNMNCGYEIKWSHNPFVKFWIFRLLSLCNC